MSFTAVWKPEAERQLPAIWTDAVDRNAITKAAGAIDKALKSHPENLGESRSKGRRIWLEEPLGVIFRVSAPDQMVIVSTVWTYERRGRS